MDVILALLVLAAAVTALGYPLYQARSRSIPAPAGRLADLLAQRDGIYAMLRDLDLDYELGKLDAADYQARREKYLGRAVVILQQLDAQRGLAPGNADASAEIDREVAVLRKQGEIDREVSTLRRQRKTRGTRFNKRVLRKIP